MKREIKFRIWNGSKMENNVMAGFLGAFYVQGIDENDSACMSPMNTKYFDETPLMQFTGMKDNNGKDIYEGDIIKKTYGCSVPIFSVAWHNERAMFIQNDGYNEALCHLSPQNMEIIGNIYENPDLLKV